MELFFTQLSEFFGGLIRSTVQVSILVCLILAIKAALRGRLPARWHYLLWLVVVVRMIMPWAPESRLSVFNLMPDSALPSKAEFVSVDVEEKSSATDAKPVGRGDSRPKPKVSSPEKGPEAASKVTAENTTSMQPTVVYKPEDGGEAGSNTQTTGVTSKKSLSGKLRNWRAISLTVIKFLPLVWLGGAVALGAYVCIANLALWKLIKRERLLTEQEILGLLEDCKEQMGSRTVLGVVVSDKVKSPVLFGFVRPRLLLPVGIIETLSVEELRYVFLHELAHLKRCDILLGWLTSLLTIVHWFNPLVWYAFYRMRVDRELACDGLALSTMKVDEPQEYGRTIVNLLERFSRVRYVPGMVGILESKVQLERRITMIAKFKKGSQRITLLAVLLIVMMACVSLTDARRIGGMARTGGSSFEGTWSGMAVDKPEDGTSEDSLKLVLKIDEYGRLAGEAFGEFVKDGYCRLENLKVVSNRISFEVAHRIANLRMGVTLELKDGKLQGEGLPIDMEEDRCDITLRRESSAGTAEYTAPMPGRREAILYYSFDRDEGQTVTDKSGEGRHGRVHGARYETNGRIGGAFSFDGEDDYISVQNVNLKEFSFSAWVKASNSEGSIIRGGDRTRSVSTGARREFRPRGPSINNSRIFTLDDGMHYYALQGNVRGGLSIVADGEEINEYNWQFAVNTWAHLTLTHEAGTFKLYKDGQLTETGHMSSNPVAGTLCIGGTNRHGGDFWRGMIDEVAVFSRALSETEVRQLYNVSGGPGEVSVEPPVTPRPEPTEYTAAPGKREAVLYYSFDRDEGQKVTDKSGAAHHGSVQGASYERDGKVGGAMSFNGSGDYISTPDVRLEDFSFSAWVKTPLTGGAANNRFIFTLDDGMHYYALQGNVGGALSIVSDGEEINEYDWQFGDNAWVHLTLTHERGTFKLYKNGALTQTGTLASSSVAGTLCIGGTSRHRGSYWQGMIDEVALFNQALSEAEVRQLYDNQHYRASGRPRRGPAVVSPPTRPRPGFNGGLARFAGTWSGMAVDKPEDGTSRDPLTIKLEVDEYGQLAGEAFGSFVSGGHCRLENLKVAGNQLSFAVTHRFRNTRTPITLDLKDGRLQGEGNIGGDRCDITLERKSAGGGARATTGVKKKG